VLIDAFAAIAHRYPDWDLQIWGDGPLRPELEKRVRLQGLTGRVKLPGRTDRLCDELRQGDIFVLSSDFEGFPNVMLEAMAIGLPCIAADCRSGPRELAANGKLAMLVPPGRPVALASAIEQFIVDPDLRQEFGTRAAASVRQVYALSAILSQWDSLIASVAR
jgi:glycosyltransferase involved in cell wall biosynthesis